MKEFPSEAWDQLQKVRRDIQAHKLSVQAVIDEMQQKLIGPVGALNRSLREARRVLTPVCEAAQDYHVMQPKDWKESDEGYAYASWSNELDDIDTDLCGDFKTTEDPKEMIGDIEQVIQDLGERLKKAPAAD